MQIEDVTLLKCLGKGSFGEVYLSTKKGRNQYFATKKMDRKQADQPSVRKYFENEIKILQSLNHPNIVKLEEVKATKDYYYIVMEYINGGSLTDCLKKYQKRYGKAFPESIVQYLMIQIVDAIKYIHARKIIHRDLKLDNIMVNFDNENDKNNLNMMRARIKIIDFGFAINMKGNLAFSALGSPINMDPTILRKFSKKDNRQLGYDEKADVWSLGTVCYEMLIGQSVFNADTMNELVKKVENGSYSVPTSVSREVVSFLNGMLQYDGNNRLSAEELAKSPFLTKRVSDFTKIDTRRVSRKIDNKGLNINVKKNQTIWAIFNEEDEKKLINIRGGRDLPVPEDTYTNTNKRRKTDTNIPRVNKNNQFQINNPIQRQYTNNRMPYGMNSMGSSFYGQNMHPAPIQQLPGMQQPIPQMGGMSYNSPLMNYPTFGVPMAYPYGGGMGGMYPQPNMPGIQPNYPVPGYMPPNISNMSNIPPPGYAPLNNDDDDRGGDCIII